MTSLTTWILEPRDPLLVRDGRPFSADPGAGARSLDFPYPATTAGAVRSVLGRDATGVFDAERIETVLRQAVHGPMLVELAEDDRVATYFAPAPADAIGLKVEGTDKTEILRRLLPANLPAGALTDLPADLAPLLMIDGDDDNKEKPAKLPTFWRWEHFAQWLSDPNRMTDHKKIRLAGLGLTGLAREERVQIARDPATRAAKESMLFTTSSLEFTTGDRHEPFTPADETADHEERPTLSESRRLALAVAVAGEMSKTTAPVPLTLGGERRLSFARRNAAGFPDIPSEVAKQIVKVGACRLILLTPACFAAGFRPEWLLTERKGVTAALVAAATNRPQVISGWDLKAGEEKATRRLAPAGSVYFLRLSGTADQRRNWIAATWMACVSDAERDRLDGFGLAALGAWDGELVDFA